MGGGGVKGASEGAGRGGGGTCCQGVVVQSARGGFGLWQVGSFSVRTCVHPLGTSHIFQGNGRARNDDK